MDDEPSEVDDFSKLVHTTNLQGFPLMILSDRRPVSNRLITCNRRFHALRGIMGNQGKVAKLESGEIRFSSYFRCEFHFREEIMTVSGETPFLYFLAFLCRLS